MLPELAEYLAGIQERSKPKAASFDPTKSFVALFA